VAVSSICAVLLELHLRDLGVIEEARVDLSPGLNVVTGETGVGKTLLVTSLALLTGARGHARLVRAGAKEALVQAVVKPTPAMREILDGSDVGDEDEVPLVRRLSAEGRSRAWAGGQLVPLATLSELGEALVELHGQGAGFALAKPKTQLEAIDALAGNGELVSTFRTRLQEVRSIERELRDLEEQESGRERELEVLSHQLEEIERADLGSTDEEQILVSIARLEHAEKLGEIASEVSGLAGPEGASGGLAEAHERLLKAVPIDPAAADLAERLAGVATEASELARDLRSWAEGLEADPASLESLRERRALIASLKRKHGAASLDEVMEVANSFRERLARLEGSSDRAAGLEAELTSAEDELKALETELSERRQRAARKLQKDVRGELPALALPGARFEVVCSRADRTETGSDQVEFLFSASKSRSPEPIGKIASGGELSRAMIAVTLSLAKAHAAGVLVLDEADQGIGGEAALELARRLHRLGETHQVLVVSHLPQIAAFADHHIAVRKEGEAVTVETLDEKSREAEISRMLAGLGSSELARAHASELMDLAAGSGQGSPPPPPPGRGRGGGGGGWLCF
jgi:DNA repair protein RecN (Recombination protein N)